MKVSSWLHDTALSGLLLFKEKCGPQIVFTYSIIALTIALYSFKNPSFFKSVKALFMHAKLNTISFQGYFSGMLLKIQITVKHNSQTFVVIH